MIDLPIALALNVRWREPKDQGSRVRGARRIALDTRRFAREWHRASSEEWLMRFEHRSGQPDPRN